MTADEIELAILQSYIAQHKSAELADPQGTDKCARELDMRNVIAGITHEKGADLDYTARIWLTRLAPQTAGSNGTLRPCSDSRFNKNAHLYNARAFIEANKTPAWDRIRELEQRQPNTTKELEQKFKILYSEPQAHQDFDLWAKAGKDIKDYYIGVLFLDVDDFKAYNTRYSETVVDQTLLPEIQTLVRNLCLHRGAAYRYGGEEFLILLPNQSLGEASSFAERLRMHINRHTFSVKSENVSLSVSVGVAAWPSHGNTAKEVISRANSEEGNAKKSGKNRVCIASPPNS